MAIPGWKRKQGSAGITLSRNETGYIEENHRRVLEILLLRTKSLSLSLTNKGMENGLEVDSRKLGPKEQETLRLEMIRVGKKNCRSNGTKRLRKFAGAA